ncbi:orotate phosphoribosyltransferase [Longirhabdus pacifica]|uniref:orotate phosphoribosyltransferase n=1 Tax=Longirhabdus pacifica TaxID=2305227 RepID=UPI0010092F71|nr:orotate phosphoribosyltransferase [Longirhabdus pacifica]
MSHDPLATSIAQHLLNIGAVALSPKAPFTWASGMKSPIYCDNRLTLSHPTVRDEIASGFVKLIQTTFPDVEVIAGTATGAIAHAAFIAQKMELPMVYIRDKAKGHGKQNQIEGRLTEGQKVVVIEDLISTGGSSLKAALAVKEAQAEVLGTVSIFTYEFAQSKADFAEHNIPLYSLSNFSTLVEVAKEKGDISEQELQLLHAWRQDPQSYR